MYSDFNYGGTLLLELRVGEAKMFPQPGTVRSAKFEVNGAVVSNINISVTFGTEGNTSNLRSFSYAMNGYGPQPTLGYSPDNPRFLWANFASAQCSGDTGYTPAPTPAPSRLYSFTTHTFTNAGASGRDGPTLQQVRAAYSSASWAQGSYLDIATQGIQLWTVPANGTYTITAAGARGGKGGYNRGGNGAIISGSFSLVKGEVLKILVGQAGVDGNYIGGGGGGSFVVRGTQDALMVAGGGGGGEYAHYGNYSGWKDAVTSISGNAGTCGAENFIKAEGGTNGNGGSIDNRYSGAGAAGGGLLGNGAGFYNTEGGRAFTAGGRGGASTSGSPAGDGGFGGGGASEWQIQTGGGGGGGYSGGGGGSYYGVGGGGGSYNAGSKQNNSVGNSDHGYVTITFESETTGPPPPTASPMGSISLSGREAKSITLANYFSSSTGGLSYSLTANPYGNGVISGSTLIVTGGDRSVTYVIDVKGTDSNGGSAVSSLSVTETPAPTPSPTPAPTPAPSYGGNSKTFTQTMLYNVDNANACTQWNSFCQSLTPGTYTYLTFTGSASSSGAATCSNPTIVNGIARALRDATPFTATDSSTNTTWMVGSCGEDARTLSTVGSVCQCDSGYTYRPCIRSGSYMNWGGAGTATCYAPTQTITIEFR